MPLTRASSLSLGASGVDFGLLRQREVTGGKSLRDAGARKKGVNRTAGRTLECAIKLAIELGG